MEKKNKVKLARISLTFFVTIYLVLVGIPSATINNGDRGDLFESIAISTKKDMAYGETIMSIPEALSSLSPGDSLVVETRLREFDFKDKADIIIEYEIDNSEGELVLRQHETVALQTQASFLKTFTLPSDLGFGRYLVHGTIKDLEMNVLATTTASFDISKPIAGYSQSQSGWTISKNALLALSILAIMILLALLSKYLRSEKATKITNSPINQKPGYKELVEAIIRQNHFFGGKKSIDLANRIKGLKVDENGKILTMKENGKETMINLIDLYRISIGQSSIRIAREAIKGVLIFNPSLVVPDELKLQIN